MPLAMFLRAEKSRLVRQRDQLLSEAGLDALEAGIELPEAAKYVTELRGLFEYCRSVDEDTRRLDETPADSPIGGQLRRHIAGMRDRVVCSTFVRPRVLRTSRRLGETILQRKEPHGAFHLYRERLAELEASLGQLELARLAVLKNAADGPIDPRDIPFFSERLAASPPQAGRDDHSGITITAREVSKRYGVSRILRGISLDVRPGEFVGLLGPSGAGKSTLLSALNGTAPVIVGKVLYNGRDFYQSFHAFRHLLGNVPQDDIIHRTLSVHRVLLYGSLLRGVGAGDPQAMEARIQEVLQIVELQDRQSVPVRSLSGGQRKRVSIAMELLNDPKVMFLDEPTSGLDPALEEKMMAFFREQARGGRTVILTTHVMESISLLDVVAILTRGQLVYFGPPARAPRFFGVEHFKDIYRVLEQADASKLVAKLKESSFYRSRLDKDVPPMSLIPQGGAGSSQAEPIAPANEPAQSPMLPAAAPVVPTEKPPGPPPSRWAAFLAQPLLELGRDAMDRRQFGILARRHLEMLRADTRSTALLLLQAPVIAVLLSIVQPAAPTLLFILALTALWFGCSNSVREIVKERAIYARERMVFLLIPPYIASKLRNLAVLSLAQCLILTVVGPWGSWSAIGGVGTAPVLFITLLLSAICGVSLGLLLSSLVRTSDKAMSLVPLVVLPQILFSGAMVRLEDLGTVGRFFSHLCPLKWSYQFMTHYHIENEWSGLVGMVGMNVLFTLMFLLLAWRLLSGRDPVSAWHVGRRAVLLAATSFNKLFANLSFPAISGSNMSSAAYPQAENRIRAAAVPQFARSKLAMNKPSSVGIGALIGLLLGYPLSYFFQPGALRQKMSLGDYIQHIGDVFNSKDLVATAIGVWIGAVIIFALLGLMLTSAMASRRDDRP
jgi:ABC-type multidrug transport system ATPase subunit/ABC-type multidrug transport system permease subunit